jgi:hypothetical protein
MLARSAFPGRNFGGAVTSRDRQFRNYISEIYSQEQTFLFALFIADLMSIYTIALNC